MKIMNIGPDMMGKIKYFYKFFRDFNHDNKEGYGTLIFTNSDKFIGHFKSDQIHGNGTFISNNGSVHQGRWAENQLI